VWVYEYEEPTVGPGPINPTGSGGLVVREKGAAAVRLNLVVGLPGAGKSTWAAEQSGVVIDRDAYVLTPEGYDPAGRAESLAALTDALQAAAPGETVHFVACLLTDTSRQAVVDHAIATADREVVATVTVLEVTPEHARRVNAERADSDRGAIPVEQLEHLIDAWQQPEAGSPGVVTIIA
jgi:predicted kinase